MTRRPEDHSNPPPEIESVLLLVVPDAKSVAENMTLIQCEAARMILTTYVDGKLTRRYGEPGNYTYDEQKGRFPMITIAQDEHEFAGAANLKDPQNSNIPLLDYFVNLRGGTPENYELMASVLEGTEIPFEFDYVTGVPNTGNAIAQALAMKFNVPYFLILEKPKEGTERKFAVRDFEPDEPKPETGMKGLLVDDLITGAVTKVSAETAMEDDGFEIAGHAVVFDREEGGIQEMEAMGKKVVAGLTATQVFAHACLEGGIDSSIYKRIIRENIRKRVAKSVKYLD